jgi:hypothetical protein
MTDKERLESLTSIENDVQVTERIKHAMENYFSWFQNAMSASPWTNVDLNKELLSYAGRENSDRVYESATEFVHRADKNYCRDMHQSST